MGVAQPVDRGQRHRRQVVNSEGCKRPVVPNKPLSSARYVSGFGHWAENGLDQTTQAGGLFWPATSSG